MGLKYGLDTQKLQVSREKSGNLTSYQYTDTN